MESVSFVKFKACLDTWDKHKEKGLQCLSKQTLGQSSTDLDDISDNLRQVVDSLFEEYAHIVSELGLEQVLQNDDTVNIPKEIDLLRNCIDMYDQEFMVKECIRNIVCSEGFSTQQHLLGSIALWKSESYLNDEIQQEIKKI